MVGHFMRFENKLGMDDSRLEDILKNVGEEDELIITMDANEAEHSEQLFDILKNHGFEVLPKGGHDGKQFHIVAHRKKR